MNSLQSTTSPPQALVYLRFHIIGICILKISLSHHTCISHWTNNVVYMQITYYCIYKSKMQLYLPCYNHISTSNNYSPQITHICQLLHLQKWDNYVSIYTTYELMVMTYVTRSTGMHTFQIIAYDPENMPAILSTYIPLLFHCNIHMDPTLLHISITNL